MAIGRKRILPTGVTTQTSNTFDYSVEGGNKIGGVATTSKSSAINQYTALGGSLVSGTAITTKIKFYPCTGEIKLSGSASTIRVSIYSYIGTGGVSLSGDSTTLLDVNGITYEYLPSDPYWDNVVLLLHCDGVNGSTSFPDASGKHTVVAVGTAQVNTDYYKFGTGSGYFSGTGGRYLQLDGSSDFAFGTGDFTIEFWAKISYQPGPIYDHRSATEGSYPCIIVTGDYCLAYYVNDTIVIQGTSELDYNWHHISISRVSGVTKLFKDGIQDGSSWNDTINYLNNTNRPLLAGNGRFPTSSSTLWGHLDDVRITKGVGRYSSNFSTPLSAFPEAPSISAYVSGIASISSIPAIYVDHGLSGGIKASGAAITYKPVKYAYDPLPIPEYDPYWNNVDFLAHFDDSLYYDSSDNNYYINQYGSGITLSSLGKFGNCWKARTTYPYNSYFYINVGTGYQFGSDDWTIEAWINHFAAPDEGQGYIIRRQLGNSQLWIVVTSSYIQGYLWEFGGDSASVLYEVGLDIGNWHNIALERYGNTIGLYYDGVLVDTDTYTGSINIPSSTIYFNGIGSTDYTLQTYIDEVRITKGVARYQLTDYTPATQAFLEAQLPQDTAIQIGGSAEVRDNNYEGSGGVKLTGSIIKLKIKDYSPGNSALKISGIALTDSTGSTYVGSGGLFISGNSSYQHINLYNAQGGFLVFGSPVYELINFQLDEYTGSGGINVAGDSDTLRSGIIGLCIGTGGIVVTNYPEVYDYPKARFADGSCLYRQIPYYASSTKSAMFQANSDGGWPPEGVTFTRFDYIGSDPTKFTFATQFKLGPDTEWHDEIMSLFGINESTSSEYSYTYDDSFVVGIKSFSGLLDSCIFVRREELDGLLDFYWESQSLDLSGYYELHSVVVNYDSTQSVNTNRIKVYVDGVLLSSSGLPTYPAQNDYAYHVHSSTQIYKSVGVGSWASGGVSFIGLLQNTHFLDGLVVSTNTLYPTRYTGNHGAGGFYLEYQDASDLGKDTLGGISFTDWYDLNPPDNEGYSQFIPLQQHNDSESTFSDSIMSIYFELNLDSVYTPTIMTLTQSIYRSWKVGFYLEVDSTGHIEFWGKSEEEEVFHYRTLQNLSISTDYRILVLYDSPNSVESERIKIYINGTLTTPLTSIYPTQNAPVLNSTYNSNYPVHWIIGSSGIKGYPDGLSGTLSRVVVVDGLRIDDLDGDFTGPFGNSGFKLLFTESDDLGFDSSGI
jgi:hypothetical protein